MASDEDVGKALEIIGEAISTDPGEFQDHETWKFLGLGYLSAAATASDLKNQGGLDVPPDVFTKYPTVGELKAFLKGKSDGPKSETNGAAWHNTQNTAKQPPEPADPWEGIPKPRVPLSVILQNDPSTATKIVFLFPDGSGAGTAYGTLPKIHDNVCFIGLNSPFLRQAQDFTISIERMARLWLAEVRRLQPKGQKYVLGGWSAGGYYAFEVAKLLIDAGEKIEQMVLIDSPCRLRYEALPEQVVTALTEKGLMGAVGQKKAPEWLIAHFKSTVLSVDKYMPTPIAEKKVPRKVSFIWVKEGLVKNVAESGLDVDMSVKVTRFLLEPRGDLKTEGWEELLPGAKYDFHYMTGNHFQITQPFHSTLVSKVSQSDKMVSKAIVPTLLVLWLTAAARSLDFTSNITTTTLTAQHFPELGSQRVKVSYGSHVVSNDRMSHFQSSVPAPSSSDDCLITFMQAQLQYVNGTTADAATGMWMHHVVFLNSGRNDSVCATRMPAQRFFASGNERTAVDFTSISAARGTQHLGYPIQAGERLIMSGELMNLLSTPQEVVFSMIWEFLPSAPPYFKRAVPYWLDVGGCGASEVPAEADKLSEYASPPLDAGLDAEIALIAGHLHDGGTRVDVLRNDRVVCSSEASYEAANGAEHIAGMSSCLGAGSVKPGEQWHIKAYYDTIFHPPMVANDGSLEPVMGIALAYLVESEPARMSWWSRSWLVAVVSLVVLVAGLAGLYVARQKPDLFHRLIDSVRHRGWQRVRAVDLETEDHEAEEGWLMDDHEQTK
ncbi:hypothetical protein LTR53_012355 [Teratosphaeriaceae sp. CCFEE 6253]|nr:hypothetical protein LTR53_012355 [Teratosphaeriaceae sp. CCFEE 6253]